MSYSDILKNLITEKKGVIVTSDLTERNIHRQWLSQFVELGLLEKVDRGAYISPDAFDDEMYRYQIRFKPIIYSHETALFFHGLIDKEPERHMVTVYSGYQTTNLRTLGITTFSIKKDLFEVGLIAGKTSYGRKIRIYDAERSICDCLRNRNKMDKLTIAASIKKYIRIKENDVSKLMRYGEIFGVTSILRWYLELYL